MRNAKPLCQSRLVARLLAVQLAMLFLAAVPAAADLTITLDTDGEQRIMYLTSDMMRAEDQNGVMIFDAKKQVIRLVDLRTRTYQELTESDLHAMASTSQVPGANSPEQAAEYKRMMEEAKKQLLESIEQLPEDQRAAARQAVEQRFNSLSEQPPPSEKTYHPMKKARNVRGYTCDGYIIRQGATTVGEVWTANLDRLDITAEDVSVMGKIRAFFTRGLQGAPYLRSALAEFDAMDPNSSAFIGFPVKRVDKAGGVSETTELVSIDRGEIEPGLFEIPDGFTKAAGALGR